MVYVMLADGFEETEAIAPIDVLRRAGISVKTVGITGAVVTGAHQMPITADCTAEEYDAAQAEMIFLPGGMPGTKNLMNSAFVQQAVRDCAQKGGYLAAICAAPSIILGGMGLLKGKKATCYPGMESGMQGALAQDAPAVTDGNIITGRGAGASLEFAMHLVQALKGKAEADRVAAEICYDR